MPDVNLSEMEAAVLEALGTQRLTAKQIAKRAGYSYSSHLRQVLAQMRRRGLLTGGTKSAGYRVADAYLNVTERV